MKILFMGTPDFAVECLKGVCASQNAEVIGVVTQPDKPKGRGMKMIAPPVKTFAEENGFPVYQPVTLKDGAFEETLRELDPDMIIVAAYGKILPAYIIDYPVHGCVNAHASLLPRHRGAAPINRAIMEGDSKSGVTAMFMDYGLDTGDMILTLECDIEENDDVGVLHDRLALLGGEAMTKVIDMAVSGPLPRTPQGEAGVTYAAKITKEDCAVDFSAPLSDVYNKIRGLAPVPCAFTKTLGGKLLKLTGAHKSNVKSGAPCGTVISVDDGEISIVCGDGGVVSVTGVIPEGKSRMSAADFIRGRKISAGDLLS